MPRFIAIFMCCVLSIFANEITSAWDKNAGELNPHLYAPNQIYAQIMLYQGLVRFDNGIQPQIAESWDISSDGRIYTFHIKPNLVFSNGEKLDAHAIEKNFNAILENQPAHAWLGLTDKIKSAKALDENTFELSLHAPHSATLFELSLPRPYRFIAPSAMKNGGTKNGITSPIGSGAWVLKESIYGVKDVFVPNPHFSGKKTNITTLTMKILPDPSARILALESGGVDILVGDMISQEHYFRLSRNPRFNAMQSSLQGTLAIVLNAQSDKLTHSLTLRRAILHAIDKDSLWILLGIGEKATNLFNPSLPYCDVELPKIEFDRIKSSELLEQEKWILQNGARYKNGKKLSLQLVYVANNPIQKSIAQEIQQQLSRVGISLELVATESISFAQAQKNGDFDLIFNSTWGQPYDPFSFISAMRVSAHADFIAQRDLSNKDKIDSLITDILSSTKEKDLATNFQALLTLLHESSIYMPLGYEAMRAVYNKSKIASCHFGAMESEFLFEEMDTLK